MIEIYVKTNTGLITKVITGCRWRPNPMSYVLTNLELDTGSRLYKPVGKDKFYVTFCDENGNNETTCIRKFYKLMNQEWTWSKSDYGE